MIIKTQRNVPNFPAVEIEAKSGGVRDRYPDNYYLVLCMYQLTQVQDGKMLFFSIVGESVMLLGLNWFKRKAGERRCPKLC
jgi:hypothetical protein